MGKEGQIHLILAKNMKSDVSPMNSAHRASQSPAKPLRWHKLVPVGTGIAEDSVDLAPLPLTLVP